MCGKTEQLRQSEHGEFNAVTFRVRGESSELGRSGF